MNRISLAVLAWLAIADVAALAQSKPQHPAPLERRSSLSATIQQLEHDLVAAIVRRDSVTLSRLEAADAMIGAPDGTSGTGSADIKSYLSGAVVYDSLRLDSMEVRSLGATAIVAGRAIARGHAGPTDISGTYHFLDVWTRRGGRWQVVAEQITPVAKPQS
ncbi:MAG: hypothetical protein NVS9B3_02040 [Gemmatimonadaceae bacterium]